MSASALTGNRADLSGLGRASAFTRVEKRTNPLLHNAAGSTSSSFPHCSASSPSSAASASSSPNPEVKDLVQQTIQAAIQEALESEARQAQLLSHSPFEMPKSILKEPKPTTQENTPADAPKMVEGLSAAVLNKVLPVGKTVQNLDELNQLSRSLIAMITDSEKQSNEISRTIEIDTQLQQIHQSISAYHDEIQNRNQRALLETSLASCEDGLRELEEFPDDSDDEEAEKERLLEEKHRLEDQLSPFWMAGPFDSKSDKELFEEIKTFQTQYQALFRKRKSEVISLMADICINQANATILNGLLEPDAAEEKLSQLPPGISDIARYFISLGSKNISLVTPTQRTRTQRLTFKPTNASTSSDEGASVAVESCPQPRKEDPQSHYLYRLGRWIRTDFDQQRENFRETVNPELLHLGNPDITARLQTWCTAINQLDTSLPQLDPTALDPIFDEDVRFECADQYHPVFRAMHMIKEECVARFYRFLKKKGILDKDDYVIKPLSPSDIPGGLFSLETIQKICRPI